MDKKVFPAPGEQSRESSLGSINNSTGTPKPTPNEETPKNKKTNFRKSNWRWLGLILICSFNMGNYFCFDFPQSLEIPIQETLNVDTFWYTMLYSVYGFPNMFLPLLGGLLVDYFGVRKCVTLFTLTLVLGQFICTIGAFYKSIWIILFGRFIFGLGGDNLSVANTTMNSMWFSDKELAFTLGLAHTFGRLGNSFNSILNPKIYDWSGDRLWAPLLFATLVMSFSFLCGQAACWMDKKSDEAENIEKLVIEDETDKVNLRDITKFSFSYWLLCLNCFLLYSCYNVWTTFINAFYTTKYSFSISEAGNIISILYFQASICAPLFGIIIDKIGKRCFLLILSSLLAIGSHVIWLLLPPCEKCWVSIVPLIIFGTFYSLYATVIWPSIPLVVDSGLAGTAFGLLYAIFNTGSFIFPLIGGFLIAKGKDSEGNEDRGFQYVSLLLIFIGFLGLLVTIAVQFSAGSVLNKVVCKKVEETPAEEVRSFLENKDADPHHNLKGSVLSRRTTVKLSIYHHK